MQDTALYRGLGGLALFVILRVASKRSILRQTKNKRKEVTHHATDWLLNTEPTYRDEPSYPQDWNERKLYVQKRDRYTCRICKYCRFTNAQIGANILDRSHSLRTGLHIHHKVPLSKGGSNNLSNLVSLCERCHENQHKHMLNAKRKYYMEKLRSTRSLKTKDKWKRELVSIEARIASFSPNSWEN